MHQHRLRARDRLPRALCAPAAVGALGAVVVLAGIVRAGPVASSSTMFTRTRRGLAGVLLAYLAVK